MEAGIATEDELETLKKAAKQEMDDAVEFAQNSPMPSLDELLTDVYA